jgi:hypothetical protein
MADEIWISIMEQSHFLMKIKGIKRHIPIRIMNATCKKRKLIYISSLVFIIFLICPGKVSADNPKAEMIRNGMMEILSLVDTFREKNEQAIMIRSHLEEQLGALSKEMEDEQKRLRIISYQEAVRSPRIYYDLKLAQKLFAYISIFNEKIRDLQIAIEKLNFLYQRAGDDLRIVETLNDLEVEGLTDQMTTLLHEYAREANDFLFDADDIVLRDPERIWNEMMKK